MSSINRPLADPHMTFDLARQLDELRREEAYQRSGRAGRTLAKQGRLRVVLVAAAEGVLLGTQQADSPMTVQVVEGGLRWRDGMGEHELRRGELLFFATGSAEDIRATADSAVLLTLSAVGDDFQPGESAASASGPAS